MRRALIIISILLSLTIPAHSAEVFTITLDRTTIAVPIPAGFAVLPEEYIQNDPRLKLYQDNSQGMVAILAPESTLAEYSETNTPDLPEFYVLATPEFLRDKTITPETFQNMSKPFVDNMGTEALDIQLLTELYNGGAVEHQATEVRTHKPHKTKPNIVSGAIYMTCYFDGFDKMYTEAKDVTILHIKQKVLFINTVNLSGDIEAAKTAADKFAASIFAANQ